MLTVVQTEINPLLIEYLEQHKHLLVPDVSNYAKGRYRAWLGMEAPLTDKQHFKEVDERFGYDSKIWKWLEGYCKKYFDFEPDVGLVHIGGADCSDPEENPVDGNGGECGILTHRDAGYADYRAIGINLRGEATFGYKASYPEQDKWTKHQNVNAKIETVKMVPGTAIAFNCKNPHFAQVGPNRWCINAWRISKKRMEDYLYALKMAG